MESTPPNDFGKVPHASAAFGNIPQAAASCGNVRNDAEGFRNVPQPSERKENHTLTVREASRLFEAAGVARSERSIVNWCQRNALGAAKLDAYFDLNERKYFITPESVGVAITEEQAKGKKQRPEAEGFGKIPHVGETPQPSINAKTPADAGRVKALEAELLDLKITNRGKDYFIEELRKEREAFVAERQEYVTQLISFNRQLGELEIQLQLAEPNKLRKLEVRPDSPVSEIETTQL